MGAHMNVFSCAKTHMRGLQGAKAGCHTMDLVSFTHTMQLLSFSVIRLRGSHGCAEAHLVGPAGRQWRSSTPRRWGAS